MTTPVSILIPLPNYGFDPTEAAVPWTYFEKAGFKTVFATPNGQMAQCDIRMLTGKDLGIFKKILMNDINGKIAYQKLEQSSAFQNPISYQAIHGDDYSALFLPGGHDKGMKEYLESSILQQVIKDFFTQNKPVGAICHGTLLVGRSAVLFGRKTTGLTRIQELTAYYLTCLYLGDYYRTYAMTTEDELKTYLKSPNDFDRGPNPLMAKRDDPEHLAYGFVVRDGNYLSARWPGDAHCFAAEFSRMLIDNLKIQD